MTVIPRSWLVRALAALWMLLCFSVLVFAWVQRSIHDTDIAFAYLMLFLTFPSGYILAAVIGFLFYAFYEAWGIVVPGGFINNLVAWLMLVVVGYLQWIILIPWCFRRLRSFFT
jgi:hypothetical protein